MSSSAAQEVDPIVLISRKYLQEKISVFTIGGHKFILELDDPDEFFIKKATNELRETPENVAQALKELREFLAGEPNLNLPNDDDFLQRFLRPCKWYAKSAFTLIKRYYQFKQNYSHIFINLLPSFEKTAISSNLFYPLPIRNKDGCRIILLEGGRKWKPKEVPLDSYFRTLLLLLTLGMTENNTQISGVHIIIDTDGLGLNHVTHLTPTFAKMLLEFLQRCLPLRLKSIHIINQSILFNMAFAIFKPFIEEKIRKRIFFHGINRESLSAHIDKDLLFERYGGKLKDPDKSFGPHLCQYMCEYNDMFKVLHSFGFESDKK